MKFVQERLRRGPAGYVCESVCLLVHVSAGPSGSLCFFVYVCVCLCFWGVCVQASEHGHTQPQLLQLPAEVEGGMQGGGMRRLNFSPWSGAVSFQSCRCLPQGPSQLPSGDGLTHLMMPARQPEVPSSRAGNGMTRLVPGTHTGSFMEVNISDPVCEASAFKIPISQMRTQAQSGAVSHPRPHSQRGGSLELSSS